VADVIDGSHVTAGAGGVQISSSDTSTISASSSGEGGTEAAINYVSKDTNAYVDGSTVGATAGAIGISATGDATITAHSVIAPPTTSGSNQPTPDATVFAGNVTQGNVEAYANKSSLTTTTSGDISVTAQNTSTTQATIDAVVSSSSTDTRSVGRAIALNVVGYNVTDLLTKQVGDLLGDPSLLGVNDQGGTLAYLTDTTVNTAGALTVTATTSQGKTHEDVEADLTNRSSVTGATPATARPIVSGAVLALNLLSSTTRASVDYSPGFTHVSPADVQAATGVTVTA